MKNLVLAILFVLSASVYAQTQKIGFVNSTKIFQEIPEAQEAQKKLDAIIKPLQDQLEAMQKDFQTKLEEYQKKESMMTDAAKKTSQQELQDLQQKYNDFRLDKFGNDGSVAKEQDKIINPIKEKILKAIEKVAKEEKYSFVFDQTEQVKVLLYGDAAHELTYKVIDKLKRGKP